MTRENDVVYVAPVMVVMVLVRVCDVEWVGWELVRFGKDDQSQREKPFIGLQPLVAPPPACTAHV